jgi:protein-L-isoaspartate(D-aspartate) O-methyltransferase
VEHQRSNDESTDAFVLNQALVDGLASKGAIRTPPVEAAFRAVPRHFFVPGVPLDQIYADQVISTKVEASGKALSASSGPSIMAIMLEQLDLKPGHRVLEIGAGTGYNAALMAAIVGPAGQVVTVDIDQDLVDAAREHLAAAGFGQVQVICADGGYGYADAAPYDRIILTVGAWDIAPSWWEQIKPDGRLVLPLDAGAQVSVALEQVEGHLVSRSVRDCGFMPLRGALGNPQPTRIVQLGPRPGLEVWVETDRAPAGEKVYEWLTGDGTDWDTHVQVAVREIVCGLEMWLALYEPDRGRLVAWGDMAASNMVPPLIGLRGRPQVSTHILLGETGLAALMRPPGQPAPLVEYCDLFTPGPPFALFVRQFGADESPAQRLVARIQAWDAAGRPSSDRLRIRAYRKDSGYLPVEGEVVVEKQWTRLVLDWPRS